MKSLSKSIIRLISLGFFFFSTGGLAAQDGTFQCDSTAQFNCEPLNNPTDTVKAVVIYAAKSSGDVALQINAVFLGQSLLCDT